MPNIFYYETDDYLDPNEEYISNVTKHEFNRANDWYCGILEIAFRMSEK